MKEIGKAIKGVIKMRGMQMKDVAKKMGISKQDMNYHINVKDDSLWGIKEVREWCRVIGMRERGIKRLEGLCGDYREYIEWGEERDE